MSTGTDIGTPGVGADLSVVASRQSLFTLVNISASNIRSLLEARRTIGYAGVGAFCILTLLFFQTIMLVGPTLINVFTAAIPQDRVTLRTGALEGPQSVLTPVAARRPER